MSRWYFGEDDGKIVLFGKNKEPARSKSGHSLGGIVKVSACSSDDGKVTVETEEKCLSLEISNFAASEGDLIHNLSANLGAVEFSMLANDVLTSDEQSNHGQLESTPLPKKRSRTAAKAQNPTPKRQALDLTDTFDTDLKDKCLGEYRIPLSCLTEPPSHLLLRPVSEKHRDKIKDGLKDTRTCSTVLPVLLLSDAFDPGNPAASKFCTLGGNHLVAALKDLTDDVTYNELKQVYVKVYSKLKRTEALRIASLHNVGTHLVQGGNLSHNVSLCRMLLYLHQDSDEDLDDPPTSDLSWRENCGIALGKKYPVCSKDLKCLEPTFQLAQYSRRCYSKLVAIFKQHEEKTGQCLKQTAFMKLQGLPEQTRFDLLSEVVSDSLTVKEMAKEAERVKKLLVVQKEFMAQLSLPSWEDADRMYPHHTRECALQPFTGCNFRQGIPRPFMVFVRDAMDWRRRRDTPEAANGEPPHTLNNDECQVVFLSTYDEQALVHVEGFVGAVTIIADMEESTANLEQVKEIAVNSGQLEGTIFARTSSDTISETRRFLRENKFQGLTNLYSFQLHKKDMTSGVKAVWRSDGARSAADNKPDVLVEGSLCQHIFQGINRGDWLVDLTKNGEPTLLAVKGGTNVVSIQSSATRQRELKAKVAALMQIGVSADDSHSEESDDSSIFED